MIVKELAATVLNYVPADIDTRLLVIILPPQLIYNLRTCLHISLAFYEEHLIC